MTGEASTRLRAVALLLPLALAVTAAGCGIAADGLFDQSDAASADDGAGRDAGGADGARSAEGDAAAADGEAGTPEAAADATVPAANGVDGAVGATFDGSDASAGDAGVATQRDASLGPPAPLVWDGGAIADPLLFDVDWTAFCVALAACGQFSSVSACMAHMHQPGDPDLLVPSPTLIQCVGNAGSTCSAIAQCLNDGSPCASNTHADVCAGSGLATCRWGFLMTIDCGDLGMVCTGGSNAGCGFGECAAAQEGATYCAGRFVVTCDRGRYVPTMDCRAFGATCGGSPGAAQCSGSGARCSIATAVSTCRGQSVEACLGGQVGRANCRVLYDPAAFTCVVDPASQAPRCGVATDCDPTTYSDTCSGPQTVAFCNAGGVDSYDCSSNGWGAGCVGGRCSN